MSAVIEAQEVSKKYGYFWALKPLSIKIDSGERVAVLGPNGAGKSTLLKIIATHVSPTSGVIRIRGKNPYSESEDVRKIVGFVGHGSFLYDELTVKENLLFYGKLFSVDEPKFHDLINLLNLKNWYEAPVKRLSHGLRKRADIARALIHDPDLILLDEPFAGLDAETRSLLVDYFKDQRKKTLMLSSHSVDWAKQLCRRGIFLDKGTIVQDAYI
ncbi:MAG: ABC transporter ATP-binding protein [Candidatus Bathyarchaeia archaeon]